MTLSNFNWTIDRLLASCDRSSEGHWTLAVQEHVKIHSCFRDTAGKSNSENHQKIFAKKGPSRKTRKLTKRRGKTWLGFLAGLVGRTKESTCVILQKHLSPGASIDWHKTMLELFRKPGLFVTFGRNSQERRWKPLTLTLRQWSRHTHPCIIDFLSNFSSSSFPIFIIFSAEYFQPDTKASVARPPFLCNLLQGSL